MKRFAGLFAIAGLAVFLTSAASAQIQLTPEQKFYSYQQAIVAYQGCRKVQFTQDQYAKLYERVLQLIAQPNQPPSTQYLIQEAKTETRRDIAYRGGCANPRVVQALSLFQRDLAPVLGL